MLHVLASCAVGGEDRDDLPAGAKSSMPSMASRSSSGRGGKAEASGLAKGTARFFLDSTPPPEPPPPPPPPPMPLLPPTPAQPLSVMPPLPAPPPACNNPDPDAYALYDPEGADQHTYCYIDEAEVAAALNDLVVGEAKVTPSKSDTTTPVAQATPTPTKASAELVEGSECVSPSGTSDSGVFGSGSRVETESSH